MKGRETGLRNTNGGNKRREYSKPEGKNGKEGGGVEEDVERKRKKGTMIVIRGPIEAVTECVQNWRIFN